MELMEKVCGWKWLSEQIKHVDDPMLRKAMLGEYRKRAITEWGFDPVNGRASEPRVVLDEWEKDFIADINNAKTFQINTRAEACAKTTAEAKATMWEFINNGGTLQDIPAEIRTPTIRDLYFDALHKAIDETIRQADEINQRTDARANN